MFETVSACIKCNPADVASVVLMPGDPLRAKLVANYYLENAKPFNTVRNMLGFTGFYQDKRVSVMGSGMGVPSMCLYAHELYDQLGVDTIIRIGSVGGLADRVELHDVVIADSAATDSGVAHTYGFPADGIAAPSPSLLDAAQRACEKFGIAHHVGQMFSTDLFYDPRPDTIENLKRLGYLGIDMEAAGLYMEALMCDKNALALCTCANHLTNGGRLSAVACEEDFDAMIQVALECI